MKQLPHNIGESRRGESPTDQHPFGLQLSVTVQSSWILSNVDICKAMFTLFSGGFTLRGEAGRLLMAQHLWLCHRMAALGSRCVRRGTSSVFSLKDFVLFTTLTCSHVTLQALGQEQLLISQLCRE